MSLSRERQIEVAAQYLREAQRIVCLTGAGVSVESGVTTFRDKDSGLWAHFDPHQLASQAGFAADPALVWQWYMHRLAAVEIASPNPGHLALARFEAIKPGFTLVTQNVDDLHELAGSQHVLHLHGRINHFHCNQCAFSHDLRPEERSAPIPPRCRACGGLVRPSVVWFGEPLPARILDRAWLASERCDLILIVGTSGIVYPAAQLPYLAQQHGARVIEINPDATPLTEIANVKLTGLSGQILPALLEAVLSV